MADGRECAPRPPSPAALPCVPGPARSPGGTRGASVMCVVRLATDARHCGQRPEISALKAHDADPGDHAQRGRAHRTAPGQGRPERPRGRRRGGCARRRACKVHATSLAVNNSHAADDGHEHALAKSCGGRQRPDPEATGGAREHRGARGRRCSCGRQRALETTKECACLWVRGAWKNPAKKRGGKWPRRRQAA